MRSLIFGVLLGLAGACLAQAAESPVNELPEELRKVGRYAALALEDLKHCELETRVEYTAQMAGFAQRGGNSDAANQGFMAATAAWMAFENKHYASHMTILGYAIAGDAKRVHAAIGDPNQDLSKLRQAAHAAFHLGYYGNKSGDTRPLLNKALKSYQQYETRDDLTFTRLGLIRSLCFFNRFDEAIRIADEEKHIAARMSFLYHIAYVQAYVGQPDAARKTYDTAEALAPQIAASDQDSYLTHMWRYRMMMWGELKDVEKTREVLEAIEGPLKQPLTRVFVARVEHLNNNQDQSRQLLEEAEALLKEIEASSGSDDIDTGALDDCWRILAWIRSDTGHVPGDDLVAWIRKQDSPKRRTAMLSTCAHACYSNYYDKHVLPTRKAEFKSQSD